MRSYCVGNLNIPGYDLPWEDKAFEYPSNLATPLSIEVEASNGASDYGNKYGEPVVNGFTRSFGLRLPGGERFEWVKPIMFSAGIGSMDGRHTTKGSPESGMLVVKIGGPAYRIGVGGGAASSRVQDEANADLDFDAVQRGDAEMENRMNRLMMACIEMGEANPIVSVHDQGAGGNGNVLKEVRGGTAELGGALHGTHHPHPPPPIPPRPPTLLLTRPLLPSPPHLLVRSSSLPAPSTTSGKSTSATRP